MNPASTSDLEARFFRDLTAREEQIAPQLLDDAYDLILGRLPNLEASMTAGTVRTASVIRVVCAMVGRVFSNPEGKDTERIDDYSYGRHDAVASGLLYVTTDELADLTPGRARNRSVRLVAYGQYEPYS